MDTQDLTQAGEGGAIELANPSPFERHAAYVTGTVGELLRAIARAEADGRWVGMSGVESWRWSPTVELGKRLARELSGGQR